MARAGSPRPTERSRPPRVQITYDSDTGGDRQRKELPFVLGVLGNFSGQPAEPLPRLRDRKFVDVDLDSFHGVLRSMKPRLAFTVPNRLSDDGSKLALDLRFASLDDFEPEAVALQVEPLRKLTEVRSRLSALLSAVKASEHFGARVERVAKQASAHRPGARPATA